MNNTTTNTDGIIAAAAQAQQAPAAPAPQTPSQVLNGLLNNKAIQKQLKGTLDKSSGAFATSILNLFNNDTALQKCDPKLVLAEALKAAAHKLPIEKQLGFAYIIPYKDHGVYKPQFQLGYKGYMQLAMRTGSYRYINMGCVYDGELKSIDKLTGAVDLSGDKKSDEIIGYFAYIETLSGYKRTEYWSKEKVVQHAAEHSKQYKATDGKSGVWHDHFDEMAMKTVMRNLISHYGMMSIEMGMAMAQEETPAKPLDAPADVAADAVIITEGDVVTEVAQAYGEQEAAGADAYPFDK